ncbi:MAG: diguanylate phosphodiesterase [Deltaproteobacteria bacterium RIFCSPLOWO2_12_FULL_43_16]|nr:MAG: diguanylate phosphodiesterase [Deltaproteobacteria bacterium GWA2_43_19]OGQ12435.1 MAG: diguanylate phosphodiesterase [Deltaproteobacteria bacterium RIFCSPHIGHO2_02_FULL_43_33]OGQ44531.1 MAG: diguanylate phosphodiesterase [Deltaproteobacteria bacterium RIFCSPLOWO2_01_FULL_42_9]OGQ59408.1 MAG: diguanylate phosphodiesterase [Deltaproteobacteria bacterium RIFCSPLOWO2_12_FULL_43_16]HBR17829.1 diguanylate phosphodiesterase [Deltaproteobacteria bacterium]
MADEKNIFSRAEEFMQLFKKGADFTQELLKENERLRFKVVQLEEEKRLVGMSGGSDKLVAELNKKVQGLEQEMQKLLQQHREVEAENKNFANRYIEIEQENNNLANLYVASFQLHSTLDFKEVLQIIQEIIINLIGGEIFGVLLLDEKTNELTAVTTEGVDKEEIPLIKIGVGIIGNVAKSGENFFIDEIKPFEKFNPLSPIVCIPLKIKEHVIGVIAIYKLLQQKPKFSELDYELFTLLAGHAATAIFSSKLYSESERKLSTIQGFINLLTK